MAAGTSIVVVAVALVATLYQFWVSPRLAIFRFGEQLQAIANDKCYGVAELQACESECSNSYAVLAQALIWELTSHWHRNCFSRCEWPALPRMLIN